MSFLKYVSVLLIPAMMLTLTACGNIKGEYVQLPSPFESEINVPATDTGASSESEASPQEPATAVNIVCKNDELVRVTDYIPDAKVDIKYASTDNFTGKKIYDFDDAYLRYGTVMKLKKAADALREQGYRLLIWDCYRPQSAQFTLFENAPDPTYVSDPNKGFSSHSSGGTLDLTIIKSDGSSVEMPTGFDDFSAKADRDYSDVSQGAGHNASLLEKAMTDAGFKGYSKEWWHYSDTDSYGFDDIKDVKLASKSKTVYYPDCDEYITLRKTADSDAEKVCKVPAGAELKPYCWIGKFVGVQYGEYTGYVSASYVK